jgi:hypothetical protein
MAQTGTGTGKKKKKFIESHNWSDNSLFGPAYNLFIGEPFYAERSSPASTYCDKYVLAVACYGESVTWPAK